MRLQEGCNMRWERLGVLTGSLLLALVSCGPKNTEASAADKAREAEGLKTGVDAYIFGYPLVLMDVTREVMTAAPSATSIVGKAPINQFANMRSFPNFRFTEVASPNADTLYSNAWINVRGEPMLLSIPAMDHRYYLMPMLSGWTNVFDSPGTRTIGAGSATYAITGPFWNGRLPAGVKEVKSPTSMIWLAGRIECNGAKGDYAVVHMLQDQYKLTPLRAWGQPYTPPSDAVVGGVDAKTPPVEQVAEMDTNAFFDRLNALMVNNPPAPEDARAMARFASITVAPGKNFDAKSLDPAVRRGVQRAAQVGQEVLLAASKTRMGTNVNGWDRLATGTYGTDYRGRAVVAMVGLGANLPQDAIYSRARVDGEGQPLDGANRYVIHFAKGEIPPVNGFWSVSMYNDKQFFVENAINRYSISTRDKVKLNRDGSLTIYVQHDSPGLDKESNWLPAPSDSFNLILRMYWPKQAVINGSWRAPAVESIGLSAAP